MHLEVLDLKSDLPFRLHCQPLMDQRFLQTASQELDSISTKTGQPTDLHRVIQCKTLLQIPGKLEDRLLLLTF